MAYLNGDSLESIHILDSNTNGNSKLGVLTDLENASNRLSRASNSLDKAIQILIENYPELDTLLKRLPVKNGQHPYLQIILAAYQYRQLRHPNINNPN